MNPSAIVMLPLPVASASVSTHPATPPAVQVQSWIEDVPSMRMVLSGSRV